MNTRNGQNGMTMIGWLVVLALIGFIALIVLRLAPAYMEYYSVVQAMEQAHSQATPESTPAAIRQGIGRRFTINNITSVKPTDIKVTRVDGKFKLDLYYEYRTPMMGNVDAVVVFQKVVGEN